MAAATGATPGAEPVPVAAVPPSYEDATTLPTYEEFQQAKAAQPAPPAPDPRIVEEGRSSTESTGILLGPTQALELGTDAIFLCMFLVAFLFNWVGLLVSVCLTNTLAGRLGAISGFGLSMIKWVIIAKQNKWGEGVAQGDSWLWWLLIMLGFMIFVRGASQYLRAKYQWQRLQPSDTTAEGSRSRTLLLLF